MHWQRGRKVGVSLCARVYVRVLYSPASVAEGKVKGIGLSRLAGLSDQAIRVEGHWVLVNLGIMHEVPIRRS